MGDLLSLAQFRARRLGAAAATPQPTDNRAEAASAGSMRAKGRISLRRMPAPERLLCACQCGEAIAFRESCWIGWVEGADKSRVRAAYREACFNEGRVLS